MFIIGIKRRFLPGFKKYKVEDFFYRKAVKVKEPDGVEAFAEIDMWLVLLCTNGRDVIIPNIEKKHWYIKEIPPKTINVKALREAKNGLQISKAE